MTEEPITLDKPLWSISNHSVDALFDAPPRLEIHSAPAENTDGPTVAIAVGFGVGPDLDELYGTPTAAVVVVAVNMTTGRIYQRRIASAEALRLSFSLPDEPPDEPQVDEDGENVAAGRIGFDLVRYLGVPPDGQRHAIFAWLDRLVSSTLIVDMPHVGAGGPIAGMPSSAGASTIQLTHTAVASVPANEIVATDEPLMLAAMARGGGPFAVLGLDGFTRDVSKAVIPTPEPGPIGINVTAFAAALASGNHPSWIAVFNGETALAPYRISR